jgi:hypothetical protein
MIKVNLQGMRIAVTGSGPYDARDIVSLFTELGAIVVTPEPGQALSYIIVGRGDFDAHVLANARASLGLDRVLSQEEIIGLVFMARHPDR